MNGQGLDPIEKQTVALEEIPQRGHGEIAQVLVIDRVELAVIDQILDVRRFDYRDSVILQQRRDSFHEAVGVGHVREHVVAVNDVGSLALRDQLRGELVTEERQQRIDALGPRGFNGARGGIDAEHRDPAGLVILEQIPIVARKLDDQAAGSEPALLDSFGDVALRMPEQGVDERGEVRIVLVEQLLRSHGLQDLHQRAARTEGDVERIPRFGHGEL